jgi:hypothetical protein
MGRNPTQEEADQHIEAALSVEMIDRLYEAIDKFMGDMPLLIAILFVVFLVAQTIHALR